MSCDVCSASVEVQSILGDLCLEHWNKNALSADYHAYIAAGGEPSRWRTSDAKEKAVKLLKAVVK